jgi:hypothetical protein
MRNYARTEETKFGFTQNPQNIGSHKALYIVLHEWAAMFRGIAQSRSVQGVLSQRFTGTELPNRVDADGLVELAERQISDTKIGYLPFQ